MFRSQETKFKGTTVTKRKIAWLAINHYYGLRT